MSPFTVTKTIVKSTDTLAKFERKVRRSIGGEDIDPKIVAKFLDELDKKEGVWGIDACIEIRNCLEEFAPEEE